MFISVIITAYNRQEFLTDAVNSVLNQNLERKYYEIIVVKNFTDTNIDNFLNSNGIINIIMDGTIGEFLYKGISVSKGDVISFLDDDDLFSHNKLTIIFEKFSNLCNYLHNSQKVFTSNEMDIKRYNTNNLSFNLSSISIRKELINMNFLRSIKACPDNFIFYCALSKNARICSTDLKFTMYRLHNSTSVKMHNNIDEFIKMQYDVSEMIYKQLNEYKKMFPDLSKIIINDMLLNRFLMKIYNSKIKIGFTYYFRFIFSFMHGRKQSYEYKIGIIYMIMSLSPGIVKKAFIKKAFKRNQNI
ncbi:glycosyltransferase family 2 protein [Acidiplasma aeolicum]|uniref:glycosyltransferase family 2 protein n=1 Tax=Acidiplasma aeolicum TaxID=507754 RepID=UPI0006D57127|nr:glycosyltransferase family 2 protein [Acidiplasma aeolicum]